MSFTKPGIRHLLAVVAIVTAVSTSCTRAPSSAAGTSASGSVSVAVAVPPAVLTSEQADPSPVSQGTSSLAGTAIRRCSYGSVTRQVIGPDDLTAGPVAMFAAKLLGSAAGLSNFYGNGQVFDGSDGSKFYKMGISVQAGATVTISVARSALSYLRLQQGPKPHVHGETSFIFQACPGASSYYTGWVGGFDIKGPMPACVALDVRVVGERTVRPLSIPFGGAACGP